MNNEKKNPIVKCPIGYRKDPKTGICVKMSEDLIKHKQSLRNKKKGIRTTLKKEPDEKKEEKVDELKVKGRKPKDTNKRVTLKKTSVKKSKAHEPIVDEPIVDEPIVDDEVKALNGKCPVGYRKDPKTGLCVKMSEEMIKHKQALRNKKKGISDNLKNQTTQQNVEVEEEPVVEEEPLVEVSDDKVDESIDNTPEEPVAPEEPTAPIETQVIDIKTTDKNAFLLKKEKIEHDLLLQESTETNLYPTMDDPDFSYKIAQRQEFSDTKYDGSILNIREQSDLLCKTKFELMPHQLFVRNFLSFQTPYNSLLLYHGLGTGKTCSAIGIAEEMRAYMKQIGFTKKIIIVASPNVQDNFRLQLFDERKLEMMPDGNWNLNTCIGNALLYEINPTNLRGLSKEKISSQIRSLINTYYVFMGDKGEFANYIKKITFIPEDAGLSENERTIIRTKKIKAHFNNRLVIIDEIHNIRISDANKNKLTSVLLNEIAKKSDNMRLLLLSATPMYNSYTEIVWLANLLNTNDNRGLIKIDDIFNSDGSFIQGDANKGKELLVRKLTGYISYVRGENPYIFPYRIYPQTFDEERAISKEDYPSLQMNHNPIDEPLQFVPVYKNGIGQYQSDGYQFIMSYLGLKQNTIVDKRGKTRIMPSFENMESFGYTLLLAPLESLIMLYPNPKLDEMIEKKQRIIIQQDADLELETFDQEENREIIKNIIGKTGLSNIMKYKTVYDPVPKRYDFEYKPKMLKAYGEIFTPDHIHNYSAKISNICNIIKKSSSGIILIYSQYIDGGVIPMALALESMGFTRFASTSSHNVNLLKSKKEQIDSLTMKTRAEMSTVDFKPAKYVIITGDKDFSQNNNEDIKYATNKENMNGEQIKVILISKAASEGLDFKNIRQVHILEPWYNMNRAEQIIGRGVRSLSHCNLPFEERNVEIYLHGTILDTDEEAADLYVYRSAEKKAIQIGQVTRLLKEVAVDCHLNIGQTNFTEAKLLEMAQNQNVRINLSSGKTVEFKIGDKPFTDLCDYMDNCSFKCAKREELPELSDANKITNTYEEQFVKNNSGIIMKKIRDLFLEKTVYTREHLINSINIVKKYPIEHIYYALTRFVNNKTEELTDKYGRAGYLISRGKFYAFQPNEIMDESASIFERSVPVEYKITNLKMEVPKEIKVYSQENQIPAVSESYSNMIAKMNDIMKIVSKKGLEVKASDKNWYKHANIVISELMTVHDIPENLINKYIIFHYLDSLSLKNKLTLVSYIYSNKMQSDDETGYNIIIKLYFDNLLLETDNKRAIILSNGEANELYVQDRENLYIWNEAEYTDQELFKGSRKSKFLIPKERINKTEIGFMSPFKGKDMIFKIKDMTQKRNNKGAKCEDASKPVISEKIGIILDERGIYSGTDIEKPDLCVILEIIMRWMNETNMREPNSVVLFFGPEQSNEMDVTNLRIV